MLCLLSVAFVGAFHGAELTDTAWHAESGPVVYAASDDLAPCSHRNVVERCHELAAIASHDFQAGRSFNDEMSPLTTARLVSVQPKVTGPPPKG